MSDAGWKVKQDGSEQEFGPFDWPRILELVRNRRILPEYQLFHSEKTKGAWVKAIRINLLIPIFEQLNQTAPSRSESSKPETPQPQIQQPPAIKTSEPKPPTIAPTISQAPQSTARAEAQAPEDVDSRQSMLESIYGSTSTIQRENVKSSSRWFSDFVDPSFSRFITPSIVSVMWIFCLIGAVIAFVAISVGFIFSIYIILTGRGSMASAAISLFGALLYTALIGLWLLFIRVTLEGRVVMYNVYKTLVEIRNQREG
jgi:hypothetical protein